MHVPTKQQEVCRAERTECGSARFVALLAKAARAERDAMLGHVADRDLNGATVASGEHNPIAGLGLTRSPRKPRSYQLCATRWPL
jgi:hypothetical protein